MMTVDLHTKVHHNVYGQGEVTKITADNIYVLFGKLQRIFPYPEGFAKGYLTVTNDEEIMIEMPPIEEELLKGSPEWFKVKSNDEDIIVKQGKNDVARENFIERFAPDRLAEMSETELLERLFRSDAGMLWDLTMDDDVYRCFGAAGKYTYLWLLRYDVKLNEYSVFPVEAQYKKMVIDENSAKKKAGEIRSGLLTCVAAIDDIGDFSTIHDYEQLDHKMKEVEFSKYGWALKYFQMIYPDVFPQMYADKTLFRALRILGLKRHGTNRILNMGELALFTVKCEIPNDSFEYVYGKYWGWEGDPGPCDYAKSLQK